jgi:hypothetical protein
VDTEIKQLKSPEPEETVDPKKLDLFIDMYVRQGLSMIKIARLLGVDRRTVYRWKERPGVIEEMKRLRTRIKRGLELIDKKKQGRKSHVFDDFSVRLPEAVSAFVSTGTISGAAKALGIGRDKMKQWRERPEFEAALERVGNSLLSAAMRQLESDCVAAARTLREIMNDTSANVFARLSAARTILELSLKSAEVQSLKLKIKRLEQVAGITQVSEIEGTVDSIAQALPQGGEVTVDVS